MSATFYILISLIAGIVLGRSSVKMPPVVPNLDAPRLDYLEATKQSVFYNDQAQAWAVLDTAGKPIKAARSLRCNRCGSRDVYWQIVKGKYVLFDKETLSGHLCPTTADGFDDEPIL